MAETLRLVHYTPPARPAGNLAVQVVSARREGDTIYLEVKMPIPVCTGHWDPAPFKIAIPLAAFASRMEAYGLHNRQEALKAILKEHVKRVCDLPETADSPDPRIRRLGGFRRDIQVSVPGSVLQLIED